MTDRRRVQVTEETIKEPGYPEPFYEGDVSTLPKAIADKWIGLGWAKDFDTGEQGERIPGSRIVNGDGSLGAATKTIQPDAVVQKNSQAS